MSRTALLEKLNLHHLAPLAPGRSAAPRSDAALVSDYELRAEEFLFACLAGGTPKIIIERAEKMFLAREALRDRGIEVSYG